MAARVRPDTGGLSRQRVIATLGRIEAVRAGEADSLVNGLLRAAVTSNYAASGPKCRGGTKAREADRPRRAASRVAA